MKTLIIAGMLTLIAASAHAGLSTGPSQPPTFNQAHAQAAPVQKPIVKKVKRKHKPRREDDDDIRIDID